MTTSALLLGWLWINSLMYAGFGAYCLARPQAVSNALGFNTMSAHGMVEFMTVYGGMQLAFAAFFAQAALRGGNAAVEGLWFALCLYVGLTIVRWIAVAAAREPMPTTLLVLAGLETLFAVIAIALVWLLRAWSN
jgi:hypothetical protein